MLQKLLQECLLEFLQDFSPKFLLNSLEVFLPDFFQEFAEKFLLELLESYLWKFHTNSQGIPAETVPGVTLRDTSDTSRGVPIANFLVVFPETSLGDL